jgi:hypothetical protein
MEFADAWGSGSVILLSPTATAKRAIAIAGLDGQPGVEVR